MFRRSAWSTIGGYDESLPMCVDYDLFLRMAALGRLLMLADVTVEHFIHQDSFFKRRPRGEYLEVLQTIRCRARSRLGIPLWARAFDLVPYLQAARARLLRP
jgi:GT2 family glycosyltransferase